MAAQPPVPWRDMTPAERIEWIAARFAWRRKCGRGVDHGKRVADGMRMASELRMARNREKVRSWNAEREAQ